MAEGNERIEKKASPPRQKKSCLGQSRRVGPIREQDRTGITDLAARVFNKSINKIWRQGFLRKQLNGMGPHD